MNWKSPKVYAVKHKDEDIRAASRSGGIFTALSDLTLTNGGVVYGCVLTDEFTAAHIRAENVAERNQMRGSKYIQSKLGDTFKNVRKDLGARKEVLFSGTSCQVAGLKHFLYWQEQKNHGKAVKVDFRNKKDFGWRDHIETLWFDNQKSVSSPVFKNLFYGHMILRPSCYECPYKAVMHPGDITIADYWGIEKAAPEYDDNKGVSLVLINNENGEKVFEQVKNRLTWKQTRLEDSLQPPLKAPFPKPDNREQFWNAFRDKSFEYVAKKYGGIGLKNDAKTFLRKIKRKIKKLVAKGGKRNTGTI